VELITNIITEYLKHNKRLVVPKLGAFIVKPSSKSIIFSDLMRNDDGVLRSLLVAYGVQELVANGMIDRFVFEIRHAVSNNETLTIEHLGEFSAGPNNTILFTYKSEPQVFGGKIKPPVDILGERIRPSREPKQSGPRTHGNTPYRNNQAAERNGDDNNIRMGKPDAYLRGLKYDNSKNKKRGEDGSRNSKRGISKGMVIVIATLVLIGAGIGLYFGLRTPKPEPSATTSLRIEERDTMQNSITDSLNTDSLMLTTPNIELGATANE
jgi:nucleoid DNA-binding protein